MNFLRLIIEANIVVQLVILVLIFFSVFSWAVIISKRSALKSAFSQSEKFLKEFRKSTNLSDVNKASRKYRGSPMAAIFQSGYKELAYLSKSNPGLPLTSERLEGVNRALVKASNQEISKLEKMMSFLVAFQRIGIVRSAGLDVVAPGIAEALIATAAGLFAAIPAVIAYNHYLHRIKTPRNFPVGDKCHTLRGCYARSLGHFYGHSPYDSIWNQHQSSTG
jgi:biopolymer transport protein TolQ